MIAPAETIRPPPDNLQPNENQVSQANLITIGQSMNDGAVN